MIQLDPKSTALVLIDLQKGILGYPLTEGHEMSIKHILPRIARLIQSDAITLTCRH